MFAKIFFTFFVIIFPKINENVTKEWFKGCLLASKVGMVEILLGLWHVWKAYWTHYSCFIAFAVIFGQMSRATSSSGHDGEVLSYLLCSNCTFLQLKSLRVLYCFVLIHTLLIAHIYVNAIQTRNWITNHFVRKKWFELEG